MNRIPEYAVTIDEYWLNLLVSTLLPIVVALVTKRLASGTTKSVVLLVLSTIVGFLTSLQATGGEFELKAAVIGIVLSFVTAVGSHFGLLGKNGLDITGKNGKVATAVPGGIGSNVQDPQEV